MSIQPLSSSTSSASFGAQREITGMELVVRSVIAATMGIIPFVGSKIGEGMVKGSAFIVAQTGVVLFGIPAVIGGALLTGGAFVFAQSQVLAWGRELVEHPQEEKANTRLARYGAGDKPLRDLKDLFQTFFCGTRADLERWKSFEAT